MRTKVMVEPVTLTTVEYSGCHVYRNGRLERVGNSYGYWADSTFHYHITDYQGNIRAVIAGDGALEEVNNYYPYGGLMGAADTGVQPHKYGAKELDRENGLDLYDSHARWYDPLLARTTTQDPLSEKYHHLSPYAWCAGNPIRNIDEGGDSIAVLYSHGLIGHLALLIQDENKKWSYFSMNGTKIFGGSSGMSYGKSGGKPYNDLGIMKFNSPTEFLNSQYNSEGSSDEIQDNTVNNYGYEDAYVIPTTRVQDASIEPCISDRGEKIL